MSRRSLSSTSSSGDDSDRTISPGPHGVEDEVEQLLVALREGRHEDAAQSLRLGSQGPLRLVSGLIHRGASEAVTWLLSRVEIEINMRSHVLRWALPQPVILGQLLAAWYPHRPDLTFAETWRQLHLHQLLIEAIPRAPLTSIQMLLEHGLPLGTKHQLLCLRYGRADVLAHCKEIDLGDREDLAWRRAGCSGELALPLLRLLEERGHPTEPGARKALGVICAQWLRKRPTVATVVELLRLGADLGRLSVAQLEELFADRWSLRRLRPADVRRVPWHLAAEYVQAREQAATGLLKQLPGALAVYVLGVL